MMRTGFLTFSASVLLLTLADRGPAGKKDTGVMDLKVVKYADLQEIVRSQRGKVLLLDFWGLG